MKEAAHQLNYNDDTVLHLIKATIPSEIYGTLHNQDDFNVVITMVKDIYVKKPEPTNPPTATGGAATPFTLIRAPNGGSKRVHFQGEESLLDRINRLTETSIIWTWKGNQPTSEYMDRYDGITSELNVIMEYDDAMDVTTAYLGQESTKITDTFKPEQTFPIYSNCHTWGQSVGGGMINILLDTGASKSYMSKGFYMRHPHLHKYPKFSSTIKNL